MCVSQPNESPSQDRSLYERLGGADTIASISADIVDRHLANPAVKTRFQASDIPMLKKHVTEFFKMGTGGPSNYTGRDMITAHKGMNVNEAELVAVFDDVLAALDAHKIDATSRSEVLGILYSLKDEVMHQ